MSIIKTIRAMLRHPLNRGRPVASLSRFVRWQIASRLHGGDIIVSFVNESCLIARQGLTGATGNIYCGLHEFEDMALVLHALRPGDLFVDVGANIGSYTILAGAAAGADVLALEPIPATYKRLRDNISINLSRLGRAQDADLPGTCGRMEALNLGAGNTTSTLTFTADRDTMNRVATNADHAAGRTLISVPIRRLDDVLNEAGGREPALIKIDVEGFEANVIAGAQRTLASPSLLAVVMEANEASNQCGHDDGELHERMLNMGFSVRSYDPWRRTLFESTGGTPRNVLYVKDVDRLARRVADAPSYRVYGRQL